MRQKRVERSNAFGAVGTTDGSVGVAQDGHRLVKDVRSRVTVANEVVVAEPAKSGQILPLTGAREVILTVVLVEVLRALHPEVRPS